LREFDEEIIKRVNRKLSRDVRREDWKVTEEKKAVMSSGVLAPQVGELSRCFRNASASIVKGDLRRPVGDVGKNSPTSGSQIPEDIIINILLPPSGRLNHFLMSNEFKSPRM
jgi:hypothetical protein